MERRRVSNSEQPDPDVQPADPAVQAPDSDALPPAAKATLDKKKTIIGGIVTLIVLGFVFWGLSKNFGSFSDAWAQIQQMTPQVMAALALVAVVNIIVYVFPYMVAIPGLKYRPAFMVRQTSWMMAALVPAGGAFALALQYLMLASYKVSAAAATSGIAITSVWSFFMTFLLPVLGVLVLIPSGELQSSWVWAGVLGLAALVVMVIIFWLILRSEQSARKIAGWGQKVAAPVMRKLNRNVDLTSTVLDFRGQVVDVVKAKW
ncbi:MAG: putative heme transporter, partial [Actinomycetota bacterium]|nr:putative heme transporter [Actinomycetota bacterium]